MRFALSAAAASDAPSSTRWGSFVRRKASFRLAGSPSGPLATTTGRRTRPPLTARHLAPTGNQAPPWPRRPLASSSSSKVVLAERRVRAPHWALCCDRSKASPDFERPERRRGKLGAATGREVAAAIGVLTVPPERFPTPFR